MSTIVCVFFFKQKTAYEMRISDWSSDVCSSDLIGLNVTQRVQPTGPFYATLREKKDFEVTMDFNCQSVVNPLLDISKFISEDVSAGNRSEEHTSELQSLMRISYAVFCLKKKTNITTINHILSIHI